MERGPGRGLYCLPLIYFFGRWFACQRLTSAAIVFVLSVQASKLFSENDMEGMFALLTPLHQQMSVVRFHFPVCRFSPIAGP